VTGATDLFFHSNRIISRLHAAHLLPTIVLQQSLI